MPGLLQFLKENCVGGLLPWLVQLGAAECFNTTISDVESVALENEILPSRYQRNQNLISVSQQRKLFNCRVAVVGCGALGGYVLEQLARLGVGTLVAIDPDNFEEHNINRQLLATCKNCGQAKVEAAANRILDINPAVTLIPFGEALTRENGEQLLNRADCVVDCVDTIDCRLDLAKICTNLNVPLIHGAIAGWSGQICAVLPGDLSLETLYCHNKAGQGVEKKVGNPAFTPAVIASMEVAETCKMLLGLGSAVSQRSLQVDLFGMEFQEVPL